MTNRRRCDNSNNKNDDDNDENDYNNDNNDVRAAVSVLIGPSCPAFQESYSRKCAYCCIIGQIK